MDAHYFDQHSRRMDLLSARLSIAIAAHFHRRQETEPLILPDPKAFPLIDMGWLRHLRYL